MPNSSRNGSTRQVPLAEDSDSPRRRRRTNRHLRPRTRDACDPSQHFLRDDDVDDAEVDAPSFDELVEENWDEEDRPSCLPCADTIDATVDEQERKHFQIAGDSDSTRRRRRTDRGLRPRPRDDYTNQQHGRREEEDFLDMEEDFLEESLSFDDLVEHDEDHEDRPSGPRCADTIDATADEQEREYFHSELSAEDQYAVVTRRWMWELCKHRSDADVLGRLVHWTTTRHKHPPQPHRGLPKPWTAKSSRRLAEETGWTEDSVSKSLRRLKEQGLIDWEVRMFGKNPERHIWLNWRTIREAYHGTT